jgi:DNA polymerase III gamma/tau subunit
VCRSEKLNLGDDVLKFLATQARGSFRDAIKLLEQSSQQGISTLPELEKTLGRQYHTLIPSLAAAILKKDSAETIQIFQNLRTQGTHEVSFHKDLIAYLHTQLLITAGLQAGTTEVPYDAARFLLQELSASELSVANPLPFLRLELKLLEVIERALKKSRAPEGSSSAVAKPQPHQSSAATSSKSPAKKAIEIESQLEEEVVELLPVSSLAVPLTSNSLASLSGNGELLYQQWQNFVTQVAQTNFSLATLLKSAQPISGETGKITLSVFYKFHQEQLLQPKFTQQLNSLISTTYGGPVQINCILTKQPNIAELAEPTTMPNLEKLATDALM